MAKKKTTIESMIVKELTKKSTPKKSISKKSSSTSAKQKRSEIAKNIQNEAKERLIDTLLKKPRSKKAQKLRLLYIFLLLIVIGVSGFFAYEEIAPFSPVNTYEPTELGVYYEGAAGLEGTELRNYLSTLLNTNYVGVNYGKAREALAVADVDPNDSTKVITIYTRESVKGAWDGTTWTREHVWPNSRLGVPRVTNTQINQASDLHNLRAIIQSINSSRSNKVYNLTTTENTYYPGEDRGDVARILFYMVLKWDVLTLVDDILPNNPETNYTLAGAKMSRFSVLLQWHFDDPVDDFERHRNDIIYQYQNNRNPFIDHPEFVNSIFQTDDLSFHQPKNGFASNLKSYYAIFEFGIISKNI